MHDFATADPAQRAQMLLDNLAPRLNGGEGPARLIRSWIYDKQIAVLDFVVDRKEIAFDLSVVGDQIVRADIFARSGDAAARVAGLGLPATGPGRFLACQRAMTGDPDRLWEEVAATLRHHLIRLAPPPQRDADAILLDGLGPGAALTVVDVGANDIYAPPYLALRRLGRCQVVGFEPHREAFEDLQRKEAPDARYFPYAVGAPGRIGLNIYAYSGFTSAFAIDGDTVGMVPDWRAGTRLRETIPVDCVALDAVPGLPDFDLLKIDIQGGELDVFRHATRALKSALCVITEVSFYPLYCGAPSFAEVHQELVAQGFLLHKFMTQVSVGVADPPEAARAAPLGASQLIDGDAVYLRDFRRPAALSDDALQKMALLGHFVFSSADLAVRMLTELARRGRVAPGVVERYLVALV